MKKSSNYDDIAYTTAHLELDDSHITKYEIFLNSRWRTAAILKIIVGHDSATDFPISVKFCVRKQLFSQNFGNGIDTSLPQDVFFVFLMQFVLWRVAAFASSLIHLFIVSISSTVYCIVFCNVMSAKVSQKHHTVRFCLAEQLADTRDKLTKRTSQLVVARRSLKR